jgi:hypothetical protein
MNIYNSKLIVMVCLIGILFTWMATVSLQAQPAGTSTSNNVKAKKWSQLSSVEKVQIVCGMFAALAFFVSEIWFIVAGFKTSVGWGLFMLFIGGFRSIFAALAMIGWIIQWVWLTHESKPFQIPSLILGGFVVIFGTCALIFITRHWEQARRPLAVMGLGIVLILTVVALQFAK